MALNREIYTNGFLKRTLDPESKIGLLFDNRYDEPTYLTILVDFFPEYFH